MNLPEEDLSVYQMLFEVEYIIDDHKRTLSNIIKNFKHDIEKIQKCEFKELDGITAEKLIVWLKFNFTSLLKETDGLKKYYRQEEYEIEPQFLEDFKLGKKEYERHKKIKELKKTTIYNCERLLNSIKVKITKHIPEILGKLAFPDEYNKFKKALPDMIEYKKETGKKVFFRGNISKQFLKWYDS